MSAKGPLRLGTIKAACKVIGGDKPVHPSTFYRGVKLGIYSAPFHPSPNTSRVDLDKLEAEVRARDAAAPDTPGTP
jgi:hypothetical protein